MPISRIEVSSNDISLRSLNTVEEEKESLSCVDKEALGMLKVQLFDEELRSNGICVIKPEDPRFDCLNEKTLMEMLYMILDKTHYSKIADTIDNFVVLLPNHILQNLIDLVQESLEDIEIDFPVISEVQCLLCEFQKKKVLY